ncbi:MAG: dihydroorotate dehydrogenase electron transfer subunit [Eggerthellaceae bacterium]|jgi:dihydroorotate dehydrogenase electron transfer subunit|nr:dihydroorotate dehydrogenase electron transfer subunit [Eggerthellaceae bacterium]MCH4221180.1 dihydroorotate dehydrogenase electron transfer subunit [Eggerthellaceae bacterium]
MSKLVEGICPIISNEEVGPRLFLMRLDAPHCAQSIEPGQFIHVSVPGIEGHVLRRPFSVYDTDGKSIISILYQVVGFGTDRMTELVPGDRMSVIGAIGHGWIVPNDAHRVLLVGGGVGSAPLFLLARKLKEQHIDTDVVIGAQTLDALVTYEDFRNVIEHAPIACTDDGSFGVSGFCTIPVQRLLGTTSYDMVFCCGPEPLMHAVSDQCRDAQIPCQISMEKRMACGIGACLSCVVDTIHGKRRACVDGPVFKSEEVVW